MPQPGDLGAGVEVVGLYANRHRARVGLAAGDRREQRDFVAIAERGGARGDFLVDRDAHCAPAGQLARPRAAALAQAFDQRRAPCWRPAARAPRCRGRTHRASGRNRGLSTAWIRPDWNLDYIGCGAVFGTTSKAGLSGERIGLPGLRAVTRAVRIPCGRDWRDRCRQRGVRCRGRSRWCRRAERANAGRGPR